MPPLLTAFHAVSWWQAGGQRPSLHHAVLKAGAERALCGARLPTGPHTLVEGPLGGVSCRTCEQRLDGIRRWHRAH